MRRKPGTYWNCQSNLNNTLKKRSSITGQSVFKKESYQGLNSLVLRMTLASGYASIISRGKKATGMSHAAYILSVHELRTTERPDLRYSRPTTGRNLHDSTPFPGHSTWMQEPCTKGERGLDWQVSASVVKTSASRTVFHDRKWTHHGMF